MIPNQGTLNEMSPAKLMLAFYEQNQTGILYFRQNEILKVFYLNRGKISWAISSDEEDKIDHILLAKKMVNPEVLAPYQTGNKIAESFGKVLVENGVITLEILIQATREQVRHIAASMLHWNSGNYQLVQESPPIRLVSLDVDIPSLVAHYILTQMDVNIIWEELGSFSGELQHNPDPGKKNLYSLDAEQQGIFSHFRQPKRLEAVLLDFPAEGKYRILKIFYYFLLTGLLSRKETEKTSPLDFKELDNLFGQDPAKPPTEVNIEIPAMIDESAIRNIPMAEFPEITVDTEMHKKTEFPALPDLMPPEGVEEQQEARNAPLEKKEAKEWPQLQPFRVPEKQKPRWLSISFLSILLTAALIGLFLWLTRSPAEPNKTDVKPTARVAADKKTDAGLASAKKKIEEKTGLPQESAASGAGAAVATTEPPTTIAPADAKKSVAEEVKPAASEPESVSTASGNSAQKLFDAGNFRAAGNAWRDEIVSLQIKFSILLELDCMKESVRDAYRQVKDKGDFFLLNRTNRDGRGCWLVLWGRYRTTNEAELGMKLVPEYFLKQSSPPSVIELEPYL